MLALTLAACPPAWAQWHFADALDVAGPASAFHHLSASGRQSLAVAAGRVALAWEDDHTGTPRCYLALRQAGGADFETRELGTGECYDPAVTALAEGAFAVAWEDEAGVRVARVDAAGTGTPLTLAPRGGQSSLAWHAEAGLWVAWSEPEARWRRLRLGRVDMAGATPVIVATQPADAQPLQDDQLYPALAATRDGLALAWEDRRHGHTVILASRLHRGSWSAPQRVSRNPTGRAPGTELGRGTGAMRPAIAGYGDHGVSVVWLDKRDFLSGYDVYAATSADGGAHYGADLKVQDSFGDAIPQWHAGVAGNRRGDLAYAWDDLRDGNPDIWLSWPSGSGHADNVSSALTSGPAAQTDPVLALDEAGDLHLAWVERGSDGRSRLRYAVGHRAP